ncbi:hypothetical protein [Legionella tunisiensis]|uniref:hypothetical protein n=1 Tax=Legionella tunisiensis TaxID=1034944 RepID=UPI0002ED936A|nr:hypothetical protein [Legionella tunisiensis]
MRENIRQWRMDLRKDKVDKEKFKSLRVTEKIPALPENPTLEQVNEYISNLPKRAVKQFHKDKSRIEDNNRPEARAKNAVKFGIGNCGEKAAVAFSLLLEYPQEGLKNYQNFQHLFLWKFFL